MHLVVCLTLTRTVLDEPRLERAPLPCPILLSLLDLVELVPRASQHDAGNAGAERLSIGQIAEPNAIEDHQQQSDQLESGVIIGS